MSADGLPDEVRPDEPRPNEVRPDGPRPDEVRADEPRLDEVRPDEVRADEVRPDEVRADEVRADEVRADEPPDGPRFGPASVVVRRAPRFGTFVGAGVLVGVVVGLVLATVLDTGALTDDGGVLPFLAGADGARAVTAVTLGAVGAFVGAALALILDARSRRRTRQRPVSRD